MGYILVFCAVIFIQFVFRGQCSSCFRQITMSCCPCKELLNDVSSYDLIMKVTVHLKKKGGEESHIVVDVTPDTQPLISQYARAKCRVDDAKWQVKIVQDYAKPQVRSPPAAAELTPPASEPNADDQAFDAFFDKARESGTALDVAFKSSEAQIEATKKYHTDLEAALVQLRGKIDSKFGGKFLEHAFEELSGFETVVTEINVTNEEALIKKAAEEKARKQEELQAAEKNAGKQGGAEGEAPKDVA